MARWRNWTVRAVCGEMGATVSVERTIYAMSRYDAVRRFFSALEWGAMEPLRGRCPTELTVVTS